MALISPEAPQCLSADLAEEQDGFRLAWWNTSLNPPRTKGVSAKDPVSVYAGLDRLLEVADVVFLGETLISKEIVDAVNRFNRKHSSFVDRREFVIDYRRGDAENSKFHTLCLYDPSSFKTDKDCKVGDWLKMSDDELSKYYRIGQRYDFFSEFLGKTISFYVVHWSQYSEEDGEAMKMLAAHRLRSCMEGYDSLPIICLGDFNCEPYAKALATLGAARSEEYVLSRGGLFNPFWDFLGCHTGSIASENTRFMKTKSPVFDQILVNKAMLMRQGFEFRFRIMDGSIYEPTRGEHHPVMMSIVSRKGG